MRRDTVVVIVSPLMWFADVVQTELHNKCVIADFSGGLDGQPLMQRLTRLLHSQGRIQDFGLGEALASGGPKSPAGCRGRAPVGSRGAHRKKPHGEKKVHTD